MSTNGLDPKASPGDLIARGDYTPNLPGTLTFIGLRALDPFLQYHLLRPSGLLSSYLLPKLGITTLSLSSLPFTTLGGISLPLPHWILLSMSATASLKQIYWLLALNRENLPPSTAVAVAIFNTTVNTISSILLLASATSAVFDTPQVTLPLINQPVSLTIALGTSLVAAGIALETISEIQRKHFKDDPKNKGKICDAGLWGWARHINYGGYTLWRAGYGLASGGWAAGIALGAWQVYHFLSHSIGRMDEYMVKKYTSQWEDYKRRVKWLLFPGVY
ncbi:putative membrane protein [Podospora australis]|uniref:Membrane protein n=1 Tax=Podospora australis TaxID=1536484 RepID=A0AAN6WU71_9PEZI|nr:putative membrane protein [Podospora australis]